MLFMDPPQMGQNFIAKMYWITGSNWNRVVYSILVG